MTYYAAGNLQNVVDPEGQRTDVTYDIWDRPLSETLVFGGQTLRATSTSYTTADYDSGNAGGRTVPGTGWQTTRVVREPGNLILSAGRQLVDRAGRVKQSDTMLSESESSPFVFQTFDARDAVASTTFQYHADGSLAAVTDPRGNRPGATGNFTTTYGYDSLSRLDRITEPSAPLSGGTPVASTTRMGYDLAGQMTSHTDPSGVRTETTYDPIGRADFITVSTPNQPGRLVIDQDHDGFGRLVRTVRGPDGLGGNNPDLEELAQPSISFANENTDFVVETQFYDARGLMTERLDGFTALTRYDHDRAGRMTSLTDPAGNTTTWTHDALDRTLSDTASTDDGPVTRTYHYDAIGNLRHRVDRNGRVVQTTYDPLHQPRSERWYAKPTATGALAKGAPAGGLNFRYDAVGRLTGYDDRNVPGGSNGHKVEQFFDTGGRVTGELQLFDRAIFPTGQRVFGVARTFDAAGNRLTTTGYDQAGLNPEGDQVTGTVDYHDVMTHDAQNRMASITRRVGPGATALAENPPGAMHVLLGYDAADRPTRTIRYAGAGLFSTPVTTLSTHDGAGRIAAIDHAFGGNTISRYTSTFDDAGQLAERSAKLTSSAVDAALRDFDGLVDRFDHDARGQVISRDADAGVPDERFATDAAGNRTGRSTSITGVPAETHAIGEDNRLDGDGVYTYTHDAEGNRTGKVGGGESWTYTWDHRNRLSSASEAGGRSISYVYDGMDRLIGRVSRLGNQVTDREAYGHDGAQVTLVLPEFGSALVRYLWGPGTDQLIGMQEVAAPGGQANAISWTLTDHLGSVRDRVDEAGVLLGHADYTAFGEVIDQTAMGSVSVGESMAYGFTGRPIDVTTGLQNNRARWYDAVSGIWVSQDPIGFAAGDANLYRYVGNQPTTHTDPSGLEESSIGPAPNPVPWWKVPFVRDPRSSSEMQSPSMYHWAVGNIWFRTGLSSLAEACKDPWGPSAPEMIEGIVLTVVNWDEVPDDDKQDMMFQTAIGVATGGSLRPTMPKKPIHIDIGGEGRYPRAVNVNPETLTTTTGAPGRPIPRHVLSRSVGVFRRNLASSLLNCKLGSPVCFDSNLRSPLDPFHHD